MIEDNKEDVLLVELSLSRYLFPSFVLRPLIIQVQAKEPARKELIIVWTVIINRMNSANLFVLNK